MKRQQLHSERGFTLLELLMVVIIIAILASIALPQYLRTAERSRASEALQMLGAMRGAQQRAKALSPTGLYAKMADLDVTIPAAGTNWNFTFTADPPSAVTNDNAIATRNDGSGKTIEIDIDNGILCASDTVYGLPGGAC